MKQLIIKILKIFLIVTSILFAVLLIFGLVLGIGWPWWVGIFILTGLLGLISGLVFLKKIWRRRREQHFVNQVIEQDQQYLRSLGDKERKSSKELQDRWKEAMETLRKSHLKKYGNPLYVLPWYMVIGESGSGKTTAIESARLSSPFAEVTRTSGISGTRNCDWWFFEQAILIDTAGRYAIPIDEGRDKDEWQKFLSLLIRFRKKEPLNGLVVTVAADKLMDSASELETTGKSIRRRIDELMRVLGARFPVYVLVTKCDLIQGMTQFCDQISEKGHDQAMGVLNHTLSKDIAEFTRGIMHTMGERLKDLRLLVFHKPESKGPDPGLVLFPEEFEKIQPGLTAFIQGAFQENPYQETPILRGLFFSSGKQQGSPYSHFLRELGLIEEKEVLPGTDKGLFLHDLFSKILPGDRKLFAPTQQKLEWSRLTRNMGLTSWVAICIAICGLLSFSFVKNLKTLRDFSREFSSPPVLQGELLADTMTMDRFRKAVSKTEKQNSSWWVPRLGLTASRDIEGKLKQKFCNLYSSGFLTSNDKKMAEAMTHFSGATSEEILGNHIAHLVKRINLLRARIQGEGLEGLQSLPQPSYDGILLGADQNLMPEISKKLTNLYLYFLTWRQDKTNLNQEMTHLQTWLKHILTLKGATLKWLVGWVNSDPSSSPVIMADFWGGAPAKAEDAGVPFAFTVQGKEQIDGFLKEIESALFDPLIIAGQKLDFNKWYEDSYLRAWYDFISVFPDGMNRLEGREQWKQMAGRMASDQGPYFALLEKIAQELNPIARQGDMPGWANVVYGLKDAKLKSKAVTMDPSKQTGFIKKAAKTVTATMKKAEKASGMKAEKIPDMESRLLAARAFLDYQSALNEITPVSVSNVAAYKMAAEIYSEDPATGKSPFYAAQHAISKLKTTLMEPKTEQKIVWRLVTGPIEFFHEFILKESACYLQSQWETEVLMEAQEVSDQKDLNQLLMGEGGFAKKFIIGPAEPFLGRSLTKGYYAKKVMGRAVDFNGYFLSFLTKGAKTAGPVQGTYSVNIKAYPTGANPEGVRPQETSLELQCATDSPQLINLNYPVKKTFNWSPQTCGDVIFKIKVEDIVLTKIYTGYQGFPKFIKDFERGQRTFYVREFPDEASALKRMGIKYITVKYEFTRHRPVLKLLGSAPGRIPRSIAKCWD
jgi:type VI secretion system protein ImpL